MQNGFLPQKFFLEGVGSIPLHFRYHWTLQNQALLYRGVGVGSNCFATVVAVVSALTRWAQAGGAQGTNINEINQLGTFAFGEFFFDPPPSGGKGTFRTTLPAQAQTQFPCL